VAKNEVMRSWHIFSIQTDILVLELCYRSLGGTGLVGVVYSVFE